jgi:aerobic-type carbon monoxide dehydrogenase small subunit (CoxS/CutS family)
MEFELNGKGVSTDVPTGAMLLEVVRGLGLTGSKEGCGVGVCGLCTMIVRDVPVSACIYLAEMAQGAEVWTIEGLVERDPALLDAFVASEGMQCGICTPGQLVSAYALGKDEPDADAAEIRHHMSGNLCRCTGYATILEGVRRYLERA